MKNVLNKFALDVPSNSVQMKDGWFDLTREGDGSGMSGNLLCPYDRLKQTTSGECGQIVVGQSVFVQERATGGAWWVTTPVRRILKISKNKRKVTFETANSVYHVTSTSK